MKLFKQTHPDHRCFFIFHIRLGTTIIAFWHFLVSIVTLYFLVYFILYIRNLTFSYELFLHQQNNIKWVSLGLRREFLMYNMPEANQTSYKFRDFFLPQHIFFFVFFNIFSLLFTVQLIYSIFKYRAYFTLPYFALETFYFSTNMMIMLNNFSSIFGQPSKNKIFYYSNNDLRLFSERFKNSTLHTNNKAIFRQNIADLIFNLFSFLLHAAVIFTLWRFYKYLMQHPMQRFRNATIVPNFHVLHGMHLVAGVVKLPLFLKKYSIFVRLQSWFDGYPHEHNGNESAGDGNLFNGIISYKPCPNDQIELPNYSEHIRNETKNFMPPTY